VAWVFITPPASDLKKWSTAEYDDHETYTQQSSFSLKIQISTLGSVAVGSPFQEHCILSQKAHFFLPLRTFLTSDPGIPQSFQTSRNELREERLRGEKKEEKGQQKFWKGKATTGLDGDSAELFLSTAVTHNLGHICCTSTQVTRKGDKK